MAPKRLAH